MAHWSFFLECVSLLNYIATHWEMHFQDFVGLSLLINKIMYVKITILSFQSLRNMYDRHTCKQMLSTDQLWKEIAGETKNLHIPNTVGLVFLG